MSNTELSLKLATDIMGWDHPREPVFYSDKPGVYVAQATDGFFYKSHQEQMSDNGKVFYEFRYKVRWQPDKDLAQAFEVVDELTRKDRVTVYEFNLFKGRWSAWEASFTCYIQGRGELICEAGGDSPAEAIAKAAGEVAE